MMDILHYFLMCYWLNVGRLVNHKNNHHCSLNLPNKQTKFTWFKRAHCSTKVHSSDWVLAKETKWREREWPRRESSPDKGTTAVLMALHPNKPALLNLWSNHPVNSQTLPRNSNSWTKNLQVCFTGKLCVETVNSGLLTDTVPHLMVSHMPCWVWMAL